jgi:hypothetical protein
MFSASPQSNGLIASTFLNQDSCAYNYVHCCQQLDVITVDHTFTRNWREGPI